MPIAFACSCGEPLEADDQYAGRTTKCPRCGRELVLPASGVGRQQVRRDDAFDETSQVLDTAPKRASGKAVASLVLALVAGGVALAGSLAGGLTSWSMLGGFCLGGMVGLVAIVF